MMGRSDFFKYVKRAFLVNWNLLALGGATVAAFISGSPDVALPLVAAGELVYLVGLATHGRFQKAIDAEEHKLSKQSSIAVTQAKMKEMVNALSERDRIHFENLKNQCVALREIARRVKGPILKGASEFDGLQISGINRLLWIYLKLLFSKQAIEHFFDTINQNEIQEAIDKATRRLETLGPTDDDSENDKRRRASLEDQVKTSTLRLENYERARDNYEFIKDELDRLSAKIAGLAEMAVNRQDPNYITSEVDIVSASVANSEQAMNELSFLTGLSSHEEEPPAILDDRISVEIVE